MASMTVKRLVAAAFASVLGLMLGSCSPFADFVSNNWPHFAGGEPNGLPPRPGDPGYAQFIAHGQPGESANSAAGNAQPAATGGSAAVTNRKPAGPPQSAAAFVEPSRDEKPEAQPAPAADRPGNDSAVVQGGLY